MLEESKNWDHKWAQIVGRAWADDGFKRRLLADPTTTLEEYDLPSTAGLRVAVLDNPAQLPEDSEGVIHLILPAKPSAMDLAEDDLSSIGPVGAERCWCGGCWRCAGCGACRRCAWCWNQPKPEEE
jgi:hypothetical protein